MALSERINGSSSCELAESTGCYHVRVFCLCLSVLYYHIISFESISYWVCECDTVNVYVSV